MKEWDKCPIDTKSKTESPSCAERAPFTTGFIYEEDHHRKSNTIENMEADVAEAESEQEILRNQKNELQDEIRSHIASIKSKLSGQACQQWPRLSSDHMRGFDCLF